MTGAGATIIDLTRRSFLRHHAVGCGCRRRR
ncbi:MAG TPA: twin-arginine translocation signal domain-containing protein, partial [Chromatiales bacterium]|nr:twin-arginine translocation signal domain-containing protein [Chromatiales bacterium]